MARSKSHGLQIGFQFAAQGNEYEEGKKQRGEYDAGLAQSHFYSLSFADPMADQLRLSKLSDAGDFLEHTAITFTKPISGKENDDDQKPMLWK